MKSPYIAHCHLFKNVHPAHDLSDHQREDMGMTMAEAYAATHNPPSLLMRLWLDVCHSLEKFLSVVFYAR